MNNKIIFINFWPKGGMCHYSDALVNVLSKKYNLLYISNYKSKIKSDNKVINLSLNPFNPINYLSLISIFFLITKFKPEIIHLNSGFPLLLPLYPLFFFYNSVITVHDAVSHEGETKLKQLFHKFQLFMFSIFFKKIIVHSEKIRNQLPFHVNRKKVFIMHHVNYSHLANNAISKRRKEGDKFSILFFGRILKYKGLEYLVKAFEKLDQERYKLIIAGDGDIDFKINIKNVEIINRFIDDSEIERLFNNTDIVVLPYISGSQSGVAYLSLAFKKPVIATNVGALGEIINNNNGILINKKSSLEIEEAIKKISKENIYKKLVDNINFDIDNNNNEILKSIEEVYGKK